MELVGLERPTGTPGPTPVPGGTPEGRSGPDAGETQEHGSTGHPRRTRVDARRGIQGSSRFEPHNQARHSYLILIGGGIKVVVRTSHLCSPPRPGQEREQAPPSRRQSGGLFFAWCRQSAAQGDSWFSVFGFGAGRLIASISPQELAKDLRPKCTRFGFHCASCWRWAGSYRHRLRKNRRPSLPPDRPPTVTAAGGINPTWRPDATTPRAPYGPGRGASFALISLRSKTGDEQPPRERRRLHRPGPSRLVGRPEDLTRLDLTNHRATSFRLPPRSISFNSGGPAFRSIARSSTTCRPPPIFLLPPARHSGPR